MTTIAYDGKRLCSDSQTSVSGKRRLGPRQKIYVAGKDDNWTLLGQKVIAFAAAGNSGAYHYIVAALEKGVGVEQSIAAKNLSFSCIVVVESGKAYIWQVTRNLKAGEDRQEINHIPGPYAVGSGADFAEAALGMGFSAKKAVKVAKRHDLHSGGKVQVYRIPVKGVKRLRV
ncbi:hypothetical protein D3C81_375790 [compost metagenome]